MKKLWRRQLIWLSAGCAVVVSTVAAQIFASGSALSWSLGIAMMIWIFLSGLIIFKSLWQWLTYRVGMRLFISYLLIGGSTFLFCAALAIFVLYMLMGQYASQRLNGEMRQLALELSRSCLEVTRAHAAGDDDRALQVLRGLPTDTSLVLPRLDWAARLGEEVVHSPGAEGLKIPPWLEESPFGGPVIDGNSAVFLVGVRTADSAVAVFIPLDEHNARSLSRQLWFDVAFMPVTEESDDDVSVRVDTDPGSSTKGALVLQPGSTPVADLWGSENGEVGSFFEQKIVFWFRATVDIRNLRTGDRNEDRHLVSLLRTSPTSVWRDFTRSRYQLGSHLVAILFAIASLFLVVYGLSTAVAAAMIISITRSTARLTRGAREVAQGRFDHQIPIKTHDQLGDLAQAFNQMTQSVQHMLADVAEKERLAHELQLARQIQVSLLPQSRIEHGGLSLRAEFRPAQEVGGDYFDVFALTEDRLVLTIGDVAGHGLHTGLLMAALKSTVAALVHEGYRAEELLAKVGHLLQRQGQSRVMVTMAVIEIDLGRHVVTVSNAGHPPPYLITPEGAVVELLAGSLPLGGSLCLPTGIQSDFPPGSRLVAYTDGLVEGANRDGEPFGYTALAELLQGSSELGSAEVAGLIIGEFDRHTDGQEVADDLTLLVLER